MRICSMSRSWGFLGGSCGKDNAGGLQESTNIFSKVEIAVFEKTSVNFGSDQIYKITVECYLYNQTMADLHDTLWSHKHKPLASVTSSYSCLQRRSILIRVSGCGGSLS